MTHEQIAAVITRIAQARFVRPETLLAQSLPPDGMMRYVAARRAAMCELHELGMPICKLARLFRLGWPTAYYHIQKAKNAKL